MLERLLDPDGLHLEVGHGGDLEADLSVVTHGADVDLPVREHAVDALANGTGRHVQHPPDLAVADTSVELQLVDDGIVQRITLRLAQ
ncbi:hypothetical protein D3C78_1636240 [compost metagenome]